MQFSPFLWNLYKESAEGAKEIAEWAKLKSFNFWLTEWTRDLETEQDKIEEQALFTKVYEHFKAKQFSPEQAKELFSAWIAEGIPVELDNQALIAPNCPLDWCAYLAEDEFGTPFLSSLLFCLKPEFFFPWLFYTSQADFNFSHFQQICAYFEIALPALPARKDHLKRALYYIAICQALSEFRLRFNLAPEELAAFIYDFAPKMLGLEEQEKEILPTPTKAWYVVENPENNSWLDNITNNDPPMRWQLNANTNTGDILVLYCAKPYKAIHSVWRATHNSFIDPFFEWYRMGYMAQPIMVPKISLTEARSNPTLSKNSKVRWNFLGGNGYPISYAEYTEMLHLWAEKGADISELPTITPISSLSEHVKLNNERDVEVQLVEPFLIQLNYSENTKDSTNKKDTWVRQLPVKMGVGTSYYPDYCFYTNDSYGEESAKWLLETKYRISNQKQLEKAFYQARSYAMRLQSKLFVLAAQEGIWIFNKIKETFKLDNYQHYTWNELNDPDILHSCSLVLGKKAMTKRG